MIMPPELKMVFEAKHLGIINGKKNRKYAHKERARALGISKSTYWRRFDAATRYVSDWLEYQTFDRWDSNGRISVACNN